MFAEIPTERMAARDLAMNDAQRIFEYRSGPDVSPAPFLKGRGSITEWHLRILHPPRLESGTTGFVVSDWDYPPLSRRTHRRLRFSSTRNRAPSCGGWNWIGPGFSGTRLCERNFTSCVGLPACWTHQDRVFGSVDPRNVRSMRMLERVGMRKEAHRVKSL
jgi:RimJ/RimL family protein N-acetyltransferase